MKVTFERAECPVCQHRFLESDAIDDNLFCRCGWSGLKSPQAHKRKQLLRQIWISVGVTAVVLLVATYAVIGGTWQEFTNARLAFLWKRTTGQLQADDVRKMGRICNTMRNWKCAAEMFGELYAKDEGDVAALANQAMAQTQMNEYSDALRGYEVLMAKGVMTYDVMGFYGITLENTGAKAQAISVYRKALELHPNLVDVANRLAGLLIETEQYHAADALIEDFITRLPRSAPAFSARRAALASLRTDSVSGMTSGPEITPVEIAAKAKAKALKKAAHR